MNKIWLTSVEDCKTLVNADNIVCVRRKKGETDTKVYFVGYILNVWETPKQIEKLIGNYK